MFLGAAVLAGCAGAAGTARPPEYPLAACPLDGAGAPTAPPGYVLIPPGVILFTDDAWHNLTGAGGDCGAQAVRGAATRFELSSFEGEDRILWAATLAFPGQRVSPDPAPPTMTLFRTDPGGPVAVATQVGELTEQYRMMGNWGHDAMPGAYLMRIESATRVVLAEGRFEIVP